MNTARQHINVGVWLCPNKTLFAQLGGELGVAYSQSLLGHLEWADTFREKTSLSFSRPFGVSLSLSGLRGGHILSAQPCLGEDV